MKNKIIPVIVILLVAILIGIWLYPSGEKNSELTGTAVSSEGVEANTMQKDSEVDQISGTALIGKCIKECGSNAANDLEKDIWKSICNKKYEQGEEEIREFIKTC